LGSITYTQGPSQKDKRKEWRERQAKHRAKLFGHDDQVNPTSTEVEKDQEDIKDKTKDQDQKKKIKDKEREKEGHSLVTCDTSNTGFDPGISSQILDFWLAATEIEPSLRERDHIVNVVRENPEINNPLERFLYCVTFWTLFAKEKAYNPKNVDAILDLYPKGALEKRMEKEVIIFEESEEFQNELDKRIDNVSRVFNS